MEKINMEHNISKRAKNFAVRNANKIVVAGTADLASAQSGMAMDAGQISNGTALINAGISVAQTEPLGTIISAVGVAFGALIFIKIVRRFV